MFYSFFLFLAQLEGEVAEGAKGAAEEGAKKGMGLGFFLPMMLALFFVMLLMRPKKGASQDNLARLAGLKKNDRVVTAGGIIGSVVSIREEQKHITIRIDESTNTKMQIMKSSIIKIITDDDADEKST